jgi:hypothetical protein
LRRLGFWEEHAQRRRQKRSPHVDLHSSHWLTMPEALPMIFLPSISRRNASAGVSPTALSL